MLLRGHRRKRGQAVQGGGGGGFLARTVFSDMNRLYITKMAEF